MGKIILFAVGLYCVVLAMPYIAVIVGVLLGLSLLGAMAVILIKVCK